MDFENFLEKQSFGNKEHKFICVEDLGEWLWKELTAQNELDEYYFEEWLKPEYFGSYTGINEFETLRHMAEACLGQEEYEKRVIKFAEEREIENRVNH